MGAKPLRENRVSKILSMTLPEDRIRELEEKLVKMCTYFDGENERITNELSVLREVVFNRVLSPKEVCGLLKIKEGSVRKNLELGLLEGYKDGKRWKTTLRAVYDFMKKKPTKYGHNLTLMDVVNYDSKTNT